MAAGHDELGEALERLEGAEWRFDRSATACGSAARLAFPVASYSPRPIAGSSAGLRRSVVLGHPGHFGSPRRSGCLHCPDCSPRFSNSAPPARPWPKVAFSRRTTARFIRFCSCLVSSAAAPFAIPCSCIFEIARDISNPSPMPFGSPLSLWSLVSASILQSISGQ